MALYIKDDEIAGLAAELARRKGTSKRDAVKSVIKAELERMGPELTMVEKLRQFWAENPLPPRTGKVADKAFFDELSGEL
jgi:antitoxin VapB